MDDRWPQRGEYKRQLDLWRKRQGLSTREAAEKIGVTYNTLRQYLSPARKDLKMGLEALQRSAELFGVSVTLFIDDPGATSSPDQSEVDRFMLRVMGADLTHLTEQQKQSAFEAWRSIVRGYGNQ